MLVKSLDVVLLKHANEIIVLRTKKNSLVNITWKNFEAAVKSHFNGPDSNGNPPMTWCKDAINLSFTKKKSKCLIICFYMVV